MREPHVTESFKKEASDRFGIRPRHALEVCASPDQTSVLEQDGLVLRLHSKLIQQAVPPHRLVVIERLQRDVSSINFAFKIYDDLCEGVDELSPDAVIEVLAHRFGVPIRVGSMRSHFIWSARIPISGEQDIELVGGEAPPGESLSQSLILRIDKGPPMMADVAMAFCLRTDMYVAWLEEHKR